MNEDKQTTEYLEKLKDIKLSESSRARIEADLLAHAQFHPIREGVRVSEQSRFIGQVPSSTSLFGFKFTYMPLVLLLALVTGGGVTFAAQGATPGDALYPVKTEINESVRSAFAFGADAETRLQAELLSERLEEATALQAENKLSGELGDKMSAAMKSQIETTAAVASEADVAAQVLATEVIVSTVQSYNLLVANDTRLAIVVDTLNINIGTKTALSSSLALEPIDLSVLANSTEARATALKELLVSSSAELSAEAQTTLNAKLDSALGIVSDVSLSAESEARTQLYTAADLVGEVEAALTTMGTATINPDTGAIIDIDFSTKPPAEPDRGDASAVITEPETDEADEDEPNDPINVDVELDADVNGNIDTDVIDIETENSLEATSGLRL